MSHEAQVLLGAFLAFLAAQIGSELAQRLHLPSVVGQIAAGMVVGPSVLGWVKPSEPLNFIAEIGVIFLLFSVGLETSIGELKKVGKTASAVGIAGVAVPFVMGGAFALSLGFPGPKAAFLAAAFVATSAGITARVLQELGALGRQEAKIILGAAVIDDILAMLLLAVVISLQTSNGFDAAKLAITVVQAVGFVAVVAFLGSRLMKSSSKLMEAPLDAESPISIALLICLGLAAAASFIGLAAIIGAFLAGMILAETEHRHDLEDKTKSIMALLLPFFFVLTGAKVSLEALASWQAIGLTLGATILAVASKMVGCGAAAKSLGRNGMLIVGVGMVPRGEVGIIVATLGLSADVLTESSYAMVVAMSLLTSVVAPPALKYLLKKPGNETVTEPA